jgi:hypothetical protein
VHEFFVACQNFTFSEMLRRFSTSLLKCERLSQKLVCPQTSFRLIPGLTFKNKPFEHQILVRCIRTKHEGGESKEQRASDSSKSNESSSNSSESTDSRETRQETALKEGAVKITEAQSKLL